jgi:alanyl-tRNA synthetase
MKSNDIRRSFLDFFASKGHTVCPSAGLVPNDPTLMFANAGMVPFKDLFTGKEKRSYVRAASSQKCIRISGKHNDLENVGVTARHHTFFEMLGNFSFGDYFKEQAIAYAWEYLTQVVKIPQERMIITVFGGEDGLAADDEARALWKKATGFGDERIVGMGKADNFWQMGATGPCGPCSEIHFWLGPIPEGGVPYGRFGEDPTPDGLGWFEIWNLVFMQFDRTRQADGTFLLNPLPAPSIDTGMGLERLACVLQNVTSNYDTDLLRGLVDKAAEISGKTYGGTQQPDDTSMRVIADHARTTAFLMSEGVYPDNTGRSYVLRRVMRRAIRHGYRLGIKKPFLHEVALKVIELMGDHYPDLRDKKSSIVSVCEQEEVRFRETLGRGIKLLGEQLDTVSAGGSTKVPSDFVAKLYDTFGFPIDLVRVMAAERSLEVDEEEARQIIEDIQSAGSGDDINKDKAVSKVLFDVLEKVPGKQVKFTGYETESGEGTILALIQYDRREIPSADPKKAPKVEFVGRLLDEVAWDGGNGRPGLPEVDIVVDSTPFYGAGGGQVGDTGEISLKDGNGRVAIHDTTKPVPGLVVHHGKLSQGGLKVGDRVALEVDHDRRSATRRNHSATHLLHWALGAVLGDHVQQKGSLVGPDLLRFDFSHGKPMTEGEIERVEELVNQKVLLNAPIETHVLPIAEARKKGAKALFEEKYGDVVRVLTMTTDSVELCGGTHAHALGDIGLFKIASEAGVAAGVRRIEAVTGLNSLHYLHDQDKLLREIATATKTVGRPRVEAVTSLQDRVRELEKERADLIRKLAMGGGSGIDGMIGQARTIKGIKVLAVQTEVDDPAALRELADKVRDKLGESAAVLVASASGGKASLVVMVSKGISAKLKAGDLIKPLAQLVGGNGGGRPDMAQAGGPDAGKVGEALEAFYAKVEATLGLTAIRGEARDRPARSSAAPPQLGGDAARPALEGPQKSAAIGVSGFHRHPRDRGLGAELIEGQREAGLVDQAVQREPLGA